MLAGIYQEGLRRSDLVLPSVPSWAEPAWHLYVVRTQKRGEMQAKLAESGIGSLIHYPIPPHMQAAYAGLGIAPEDLPLASELASEVLSLPMGPHLASAKIPAVISAASSE